MEECHGSAVEGSGSGRGCGVDEIVRRRGQSDRDDPEVAPASAAVVAVDESVGEDADNRWIVQEFRAVCEAASGSGDGAGAGEGVAGPGGGGADGPEDVGGAGRAQAARPAGARGHVPLDTAGTGGSERFVRGYIPQSEGIDWRRNVNTGRSACLATWHVSDPVFMLEQCLFIQCSQ